MANTRLALLSAQSSSVSSPRLELSVTKPEAASSSLPSPPPSVSRHHADDKGHRPAHAKKEPDRSETRLPKTEPGLSPSTRARVQQDGVEKAEEVRLATSAAGTQETQSQGRQRQECKAFPIRRHSISPLQKADTVKMRPVRMLIVSLGNPKQYINTRHSAGHLLLKGLQSHLGTPPLSKSGADSKQWAGGKVSLGHEVNLPQYTLYENPSFMNESGSSVMKAWKHFLATETHRAGDDVASALVILHDELEASPADLKVRRGPGSARGHNGIKSVQSALSAQQAVTDDRFIKIGVGIGRPAGGTRDKDDVAKYVLASLNPTEMARIESVAPKLVELLEVESTRLGK